VAVDNVTQEEALSRIDSFIETGRPHQVVTVNPEFVVSAQRDDSFKAILNQASLALPDGVGLLWASRYLGTPLKERVTGVDTLQGMAARAAAKGYSLYLLGGEPGVAAEAAANLRVMFPGLRIAGTCTGSPREEDEEPIIEDIKEARPDMLFVAFGAPNQEKWIARNLERLEVPVAMGVGGALDFISGRTKRAPLLFRRLGLEWLYRLYHQPWRWRRMLSLPLFVILLLTKGKTDM